MVGGHIGGSKIFFLFIILFHVLSHFEHFYLSGENYRFGGKFRNN